jgi:hypothetical protein
VNRRPTRLLAPTTTCMLRNLQRQFPVGTHPIVKTWRPRRLQFLDDTEVAGYPPCKLPPNRRELGIISVREVLSFFLGLFGPHPENNTSTRYRAGQFSLAQDAENGQNGSYQRPSREILVPRLQPAFTIARRSDFR